MEQKLYEHLRNEPARLYENRFIDWFTRSHIMVTVVLFVPLIAMMGVVTYWRFTSSVGDLLSIPALFITGYIMWSFYEYVMHRFLLHNPPKNNWTKKWSFRMHGVHHAFPNDTSHMMMAPIVSIPLATLFYFFFLAILGPKHMAPAFAGFAFGYVLYDVLHYCVHQYDWSFKPFRMLKERHMRHHFVDPDAEYGFMSPFWDKVFGTVHVSEGYSAD